MRAIAALLQNINPAADRFRPEEGFRICARFRWPDPVKKNQRFF